MEEDTKKETYGETAEEKDKAAKETAAEEEPVSRNLVDARDRKSVV